MGLVRRHLVRIRARLNLVFVKRRSRVIKAGDRSRKCPLILIGNGDLPVGVRSVRTGDLHKHYVTWMDRIRALREQVRAIGKGLPPGIVLGLPSDIIISNASLDYYAPSIILESRPEGCIPIIGGR